MFDTEPQFRQFLRGLRSDDLIGELIQNDLDANASRTSVVSGFEIVTWQPVSCRARALTPRR